jgi:poly-beta-1,6-N-acetyl-D-glucosamine biosynthesis protein PgaD
LKPARTEGALGLGSSGRLPAPSAAGDLSDAERALLEQVRQRTRSPLIIERPEHLLSARKLTNHLMTLLWWSLWVRFVLPLVTLVLWMSGWRGVSVDLLGRDGLNALLSRLPLYATVVAVVCGTLIVWALINWWRFSDRERRKFSGAVNTAAAAQFYGLDPHQLVRWQAQRRLVVQHDADGQPTGVVEAAAADEPGD